MGLQRVRHDWATFPHSLTDIIYFIRIIAHILLTGHLVINKQMTSVNVNYIKFIIIAEKLALNSDIQILLVFAKKWQVWVYKVTTLQQPISLVNLF